jgi:hypothetical protein
MNLIDPNEEILRDQSWFIRGSQDNNVRIPDFENIRSYVELSMRPKIQGYVDVGDNNAYKFVKTSSTDKIVLSGFHTRKNGDGTTNEYYSTKYTDELMGNNGKNKDYEGFGIKSVEVVYDANKVPIVTVVFYDLRGNVLSNFDSKFAQMFQLPYPIFDLKIKGGFGPMVEYSLLKTRDDIAIDESGNYIITSKFVGNRFAPLADIPLLYLMAVPYLDGQRVNINDIEIKSFHELIINVKKLYTKLEQEINSEQQRENIRKLDSEREKLQNLKNIYDELNKGKENIQKEFYENSEFKALDDAARVRIQSNYIDLTNKGTNVINFRQVGPILSNNEIFDNLFVQDITLINNIIGNFISQRNNIINKDILKDTTQLIVPTEYIPSNIIIRKITTSIDYTLLEKAITKINDNIIVDAENQATKLENSLRGLIVRVLGNTRLTVGSVFKILLDDYNILLKKIYEVAIEAKKDPKRTGRNIKDTIAFPTVVKTDGQTGGQTIVFPGEIDEFKEWPEVKFINKFLQSYFDAVRNNFLTDILNEKNENGSTKYIPVNPREIYTKDNANTNTIENAFYSKTTTQEISNLIFQRFNLINQITIPLTTDVNKIKTWEFANNDTDSFTRWFKGLFGESTINDDEIQKDIFLTAIQFEARNIAHAIITNEPLKLWFKTVYPQFNANPYTYFSTSANQNSELTKSLNSIPDRTIPILGIQRADKNYITFSDVPPTPTTNNDEDVVSKYIKALSNLDENYTFTINNILYIKDAKLNTSNSQNSDYDYTENKDNLLLNQKIQQPSKLKIIYDDRLGTLYENLFKPFNFDLLAKRIKINGLIEVPKGMLIILGGFLSISETQNPTNELWEIKGFNIIKGSVFYDYLKELWQKFSNDYGYQITSSNNNPNLIETNRTLTEEDYKNVLNEFYTKVFISINDYRASTLNSITPALNTIFNTLQPDIYAHYLKLLLQKVVENIKEIDKKAKDTFSAFEGSVKDGDVKLSIYKSFQVIYENYLYGVAPDSYKLNVNTEFKFVDRAYNDISKRCVLDMKTLLSDMNDTNVSMLSAISRLLSDNNFWFYPFQGFLTTTENYNKLFDINYDKNTPTKPLFIAMYVGGLSSNPVGVPGQPIKDDGIKKDEIPPDFKNGLNAFKVQYTGRQNQMVFSNFQHSTESLKNTDEGLRIQSEIVNNGSNSFSIPKGQSLLNVYQKQSYSSTIKIPFGNMGIQPTQYYYEEFIPLFEGLYIIYNVSHSIDADNQRLETTFKGYRLKKDTNPIVEQELVDFIKNNAYTRIRSEILPTITDGVDVNINAPKPTGTYTIRKSKNDINKFYNISYHHDPQKLVRHKIISTGSNDIFWTVAYRKSGFIGKYINTTNYTTIEKRNNNFEFAVNDMTLLRNGQTAIEIPAPFNGTVVDIGKDSSGNSFMCLLGNDTVQTCVILHFKNQFVNKGDTIKKGQRLAIQSDEGARDGEIHVHVEMMTLTDYINYINFILTLPVGYDGVKKLV